MHKIVLALTATVPLLGCAGRDDKPPVFDKVEIERLLPQDAKGKKTITDRKTVAKLAAFFPGMARGASSDIAAGWKAAYRLRFVPAKDDPIQIMVDSWGEAWSEGRGDWKAKSGLKEHLDGLFTKDAARRVQGEWSQPVNGLRGRLLLSAPPRVNKTEILGLEVELQNVSAQPLAVRNDPAYVRVHLVGPNGKAIDPDLPFARSGPVASPQWSVLPRDTSMTFSLYDYGVGVPEGQGALLALLPPSRVWLLKPGTYRLQAAITAQPVAEDNPPRNAWEGKLNLPQLDVAVR